MTSTPLVQSNLPLPLVCAGKVRELYAVDENSLLLVTSDRISAFDVVMAEPIPHKGAVLTQMSKYWFDELSGIVPSHFITADADEIIDRVPALSDHRNEIVGRATLAKRLEPVLFECVVRGYLSGSAWKEYRESGTLAGEPLPAGLVESIELEQPIFSPATKATTGHDENVTFDRVVNDLGSDLACLLRDTSLELYNAGRAQARNRGIIIADTKFEFGRTPDGDVVLIDEVLTPDSSRFWPVDQYEPGRGQPSFDKQPLRDYLNELKQQGKWDLEPPPPTLPADVVETTSIRYRDAYKKITGADLPMDT
jgi:phosphoribosylaminoimidazole-succinocarboxamide synthase